MTTNARDVANLQAAITRNCEVPQDYNYIPYPKGFMKDFGEHCKKLRWKEGNTGHPKNRTSVGLVEALFSDDEASAEEKEIATKLVKSRVVNRNGEINLAIA